MFPVQVVCCPPGAGCEDVAEIGEAAVSRHDLSAPSLLVNYPTLGPPILPLLAPLG